MLDLEYVKKIKCFCGSMSLEIVDCLIGYYNNNNNIGIISSRRQIDSDSGYVNNWNTHRFADYVKSKSSVLLERDHAGPCQGDLIDDGVDSILNDCQYFDIIHIDPWKVSDSILEGSERTLDLIKKCSEKNSEIMFEVGTEQNIKQIHPEELEFLLSYLKENLTDREYTNIVYAVIQSGMKIDSGENSGDFSIIKTEKYIDVCKKFGMLSKEHNTDYCDPSIFKELFNMGVDSVNIAPQVASIQSQHIMSYESDAHINKLFNLCLKSNRWRKWFPSNFSPDTNKEKLIFCCGHYVFTDLGLILEHPKLLADKIESFIDSILL
tara:strand:+ start:2874 stop:3839 length:966 start_codon:yes stop_codon:yes gene_type:complete